MTLRIVAGLSSSPESRDKVREPTGWPSRINRWINAFRRNCARSLGIAVIASVAILPETQNEQLTQSAILKTKS